MTFKPKIKAQSAMEYLMTYGWAILIISIVLGALFSLGIVTSPIGNTCTQASAYFCTGPILHSGTANFIVAQDTGTTWTSANIFFVTGGGVPSTVPNALTACVYYSFANAITPTQQVTISFTQPATITGGTIGCGTAFSSTVGSTYSGVIWAEYTTSTVSGQQFAQMASATLKAS